MKLSFIFMLLSLSPVALSARSTDDGEGPVASAMNAMMDAKFCLERRVPPLLCRDDKTETRRLQVAAKKARRALKSQFSAARTRQQIDALMDRLDAALATLLRAASGDASADRAAALAEVNAVMREGHAAFRR